MPSISSLYCFIKKYISLPIILLLTIAIDQFTKCALFKHNLQQELFSSKFLSIVFVANKGIAFGMLHTSQYSQSLLSALNCIIIIAVFTIIYRDKNPYARKRNLLISFPLIAGGAIGNIIDRLYRGYVIDFIDIHFNNYHYPAFNIADSAIFIGALIMLITDIKTTSQN